MTIKKQLLGLYRAKVVVLLTARAAGGRVGDAN